MQKNLSKIQAYIAENKSKAFEWGVLDCCLFACDIIMLAGGKDFAKGFRGTYTTEMGAKRVISKHFGSIEKVFDPLPAIDVNFAQRGDLVLFDTSKGKTMALHWGEGFFAVSERGMGTMIETDKPIKAWRVG